VILAPLLLGWTLAGGAAGERTLERFLADLQAAADRDDRRAIAAMVQYPIRVVVGGWIIPVVDRATFVTSFDAFFTEEIKDLIAEAAATRRTVKADGVLSLAHGALRVMRVDGRFKIIGIAPPPPSRKVRGARRGTTAVSFRTGESSAGFSGTLASGEHERYIVHVSRNELLEVRVDRVRGRDVVARVLEASTGSPVDARARDGARVWTGRMPAAGDYLIDIVREAPAGDAVLTYALTVSVR
jgi:hypothetical protein